MNTKENLSGGGSAVVIFGCSFAYGEYLNDDETFGYKLSKLTNRTVYNRALSAFGIQQMLYQLKRSDFYEYIEEKGDIPEYAIFVFIGHHLYRIFANKYAVNNYYLDYKYKNGIMEEVHNPLVYYLNGLYIVRKYIENIYLFKILSRENADKNFDLLKLYFEDARRELQKRYPGIKFIILKYPVEDEYYDYELYPDYYYYEYTFKSPRWKELEQEGFIIVDLLKCIDVDLSSKKYTFPDGHPNAKAWDIITERLSKDIITKI